MVEGLRTVWSKIDGIFECGGSSVFALRFQSALLLTTLVNWLGPRRPDGWKLPPSIERTDEDEVARHRETRRPVRKKRKCCQDQES